MGGGLALMWIRHRLHGAHQVVEWFDRNMAPATKGIAQQDNEQKHEADQRSQQGDHGDVHQQVGNAEQEGEHYLLSRARAAPI
jgi:hypothetical protein